VYLRSEVGEGSEIQILKRGESKICICKLGKITVVLGGNLKNSNFGLKYLFFLNRKYRKYLRPIFEGGSET
jgi:hypothetical protein